MSDILSTYIITISYDVARRQIGRYTDYLLDASEIDKEIFMRKAMRDYMATCNGFRKSIMREEAPPFERLPDFF